MWLKGVPGTESLSNLLLRIKTKELKLWTFPKLLKIEDDINNI